MMQTTLSKCHNEVTNTHLAKVDDVNISDECYSCSGAFL